MAHLVGGKANDVGLLVDQKTTIGPAISVALKQQANAIEAWTLLVDVTTWEGRFRLGRVLTVPPSISGIASSVVLIAWCPGARDWNITAFGPDGAVADLTIATSLCCPGTPSPGVVAVNPRSEGRFVRQVISRSLFLAPNVSTPVLAENVDRLRWVVRATTNGIDVKFGPTPADATMASLPPASTGLGLEGNHGRAMSAFAVAGGSGLSVYEEIG